MIVTVYGEGGFDPDKPNNNIIEQYDDGAEAPEETKQIPQSALNNLSNKLQDPSVNSIAEIKDALKDFIGEIR
jgi:hypothetical protein